MKINKKELSKELKILEDLEQEYHIFTISGADIRTVKNAKKKLLKQREKINSLYKIVEDELKISIESKK